MCTTVSVSLFDWMHEFAILHTNVRVCCRCACLLGNVGSRLVRAVSFIVRWRPFVTAILDL